MLDRRAFLKTPPLASALPLLGAARLALAADTGTYLLVDEACADGRRFAAHCGLRGGTRREPHGLLQELADAGVRRAFGLGRDSDYFLIAQMARAYGFHHGYHGVHDYRAGHLRHRLTGSAAVLPELAQALHVAGADWTAQLANAVAVLSRDTARDSALEIDGDSLRPADGSGYLVSWCLHRA